MSIGRLFNEEWYLKNHPDVRAAVEAGLIDARTHFEQYGRFEGRSPDPLFNPAQYLAANPDVQAAVEPGITTAYDHFVQFGAAEGRSPTNLFDPDFYLAQNPDVRAAVEAGLISATEHFLLHGQGEPRQINPFINLGDYLNANPDLKQAAEAGTFSPLTHLLIHGAAEGRDLGNGINLGIFADDPAYLAAIQRSDFAAAMDRVGEVAPFLPSYEPPAGWEPAPDTPIPTDFIPPEGIKLRIPPSVEVPDGMQLPDTFEHQPAPDPEPVPGPGPRPRPDDSPSVVAAAGKARGEEGAFAEGDTVVIVFDRPVTLSDAPFTADSAALLGDGYIVERAEIHWDNGSKVPDGPILQYRVILGSEPELAHASALKLAAGAVTTSAGRTTASAISFDVDGGGTLVLKQPLDYAGRFQLAPDVNYDLGGAVEMAQLANLTIPPPEVGPLHTMVWGGEGDDHFFAAGVGTLMNTEHRSLVLDGKGGNDVLMAHLDKAPDDNFAPHISNISTFLLTATQDGAYLDFTNISGVKNIWNYSNAHDLTLTNVGNEVFLGAYAAGRGDTQNPGSRVAYTLQYSAGVNLEDNSQAISLHDSHLNLLSVIRAGDEPSSTEQPFKFEIDLSGSNQIDSFTDSSIAKGSRLPDIVKRIELGRMDTPEGQVAAPAALAFGEVWDGLGIDMADLKGGGVATLDLSSAEISGELLIRIAELDDNGGKSDLGDGSQRNRKSDQVVKLPELEKMGVVLLGGPTEHDVTFMNFTLASTSGYNHDPQQNDVLDLSEWGVGSANDLAELVSSIEITRGGDGDEDERGEATSAEGIDLLRFSIEFFRGSESAQVGFTLHFENLVTVDEYTEMLQAIDTVNGNGDLKNTLDLVGWNGVWKTEGDIFTAYNFNETESVFIGRDTVAEAPTVGDVAILGLIGIFVDEGSWVIS